MGMMGRGWVSRWRWLGGSGGRNGGLRGRCGWWGWGSGFGRGADGEDGKGWVSRGGGGMGSGFGFSFSFFFNFLIENGHRLMSRQHLTKELTYN